MAGAILVTHAPELAENVAAELRRQADLLPRRAIIEQALADFGAILLTGDLEESIDLANAFSPEHLEIMLENPEAYVDRLYNAGALFLGAYSPEPLGDYFAGPSHVLPTNFTARFFSPLSVEDFLKYYSYIYYPRDELIRAAPHIYRMAEAEGLSAHARAIIIRQEE